MPGGWHAAYLRVYEDLMEPHRDTCFSIGEIGVDGGGSLVMWMNYFMDAEIILGVDIFGRPESLNGCDRIDHLKADAYNHDAIEEISKRGEFEVLIDDGPHTLESQLFFAKHYPQLLIPSGIAIIEDVQDIAHFSDLAKATPPEWFGYGIDLRHHGDRYDNLLWVIQRSHDLP